MNVKGSRSTSMYYVPYAGKKEGQCRLGRGRLAVWEGRSGKGGKTVGW